MTSVSESRDRRQHLKCLDQVNRKEFALTSIAELGEFGLIARLTAGLPQPADIIVGVGDDAAVLDTGGEELLVATCDAQVEDTHFRLHTTDPYAIGRRALAVNLSDIAAMGARPRFALISLLLPPTLDVAILDGIYAGLRAEGAHYNVALVGGNIARNAERLIIDITLLGTGKRDQLLRRNSAQPGEVVMVTGSLGAAAGQWLAQYGVKTGMDISDGLAADIAHICTASGVGVNIEAESLPIEPEVALIATRAGQQAQDLALFGGEDYELLFTVPAGRAHVLAQDLFAATGVRASAIGTINEGK